MRRLALFGLLCFAGVALAQRAAPAAVERFHEAARLFVGGDTVRAERAARAGLRIAPEDPWLQALLAEIQRRPPPQPSGGGDDDQRRQPDQGERDEPEPPPREADPPADAAGENEPRPSDNTPDGAANEPRADEGRPPEEPSADAATEAGARPPGRMTREEAEALLRALGADERRLLRARGQRGEPRTFENDW